MISLNIEVNGNDQTTIAWNLRWWFESLLALNGTNAEKEVGFGWKRAKIQNNCGWFYVWDVHWCNWTTNARLYLLHEALVGLDLWPGNVFTFQGTCSNSYHMLSITHVRRIGWFANKHIYHQSFLLQIAFSTVCLPSDVKLEIRVGECTYLKRMCL